MVKHKARRFKQVFLLCVVACILTLFVPLYALSQGNAIIPEPTTTNHYINIPQIKGSYSIPGDVASSTSTRPGNTTYEDGAIKAHEQGTATVTLYMANGNIEKYHVSVYCQYAQPKTATVTYAGDGERLLKWAEPGNDNTISSTRILAKGELVLVLWQATNVNTATTGGYQYIRTNNGVEGWISSAAIASKPIAGTRDITSTATGVGTSAVLAKKTKAAVPKKIKLTVGTGFAGNKLTWNSVKGAARYVVKYWIDDDKTKRTLTTIAAKKGKMKYSFTDSAALDYWVYKYTVYAQKKITKKKTSYQTIVKSNSADIKKGSLDLRATATGQKSIALKWQKISGATSYTIYRKLHEPAYELIETVEAVPSPMAQISSSESVGQDRFCKYKIVALNKKSKAIKGKDQIYNFAIAKAGGTTISWAPVAGATHYKIYRWVKALRYYAVKTIKGRSAARFIDKVNIKVGSEYSYRVSATDGTRVLQDNVVAVSTWNSKQFNTNKAYFSKNFSGVRYNAASKTINDKEVAVPIKYNLVATGVLQMHLYLRFLGSDVEGRKKEFIAGVQNSWGGVNVKGSSYDFKNGVNFTTELVVHDAADKKADEKAYGKLDAKQNYIEVQLGDDCPVKGCPDSVDGNHWFHSHSAKIATVKENSHHFEGMDFARVTRIYMPSDTQVELNNNEKRKHHRDYAHIAAHEMGHIFGLNDARTDPDSTETQIDRMIENSETCIASGTEFSNIMKGNNVSAIANDIEMLLLAYSQASAISNTAYQSYKAFTWKSDSNYYDYRKSSAIKNTYDTVQNGDAEQIESIH